MTDATIFSVFAWQTTALLGAGLLGGWLCRRRPALAHRVLLLSVAAALAAPLATLGVHALNWGAWSPTAANRPSATLPGPVNTPALADYRPAPAASGELAAGPAPAIERATPVDPREPHNMASARVAAPRPDSPWAAHSTRTLLAWLWVAMSCVLCLRLLIACLRGRRLVAGARPLHAEQVQQAAREAARRLELPTPPALLATPAVNCPVVWC